MKTNARWNPVTFSSTTTTTTTTCRLKYFISSAKATKISPPSSAPDFTHSVFHGCKFWDWNTFLSSPVFEQSFGIYEPKAPSFRVFDPRGVTRINFRWQLVKFGPITVEIKLVKPIKFTPTRQSRVFAIRSPLAFLPCLRAVLKFCELKILSHVSYYYAIFKVPCFRSSAVVSNKQKIFWAPVVIKSSPL